MARLRTEQLKTLVAEFVRVHNKWAEDENRPNPDERYWDAVDAVLEGFGTGDIPSDCRELQTAVAAFANEVEKFDTRENEAQLYPAKEFWQKRQELAVALEGAEPKPLPPLESIFDLAEKQKVGHSQIALIYGFKDKQGRLMPWLVQQELDKPGSVLKGKGAVDGRDWVDPRLADQQVAEQAAERHVAEITGRKERGAKKKPCPESPEELFAQRVSVKQAALMLCRPESEVAEMWELFESEAVSGDASNHVAVATGNAKKQLAGA
jgi:hypothetical protein